VQTRCHALLGDDEDGAAARDQLEAAGVALTTWSDPRGTERHLNLMDPQGDRVSIFLDRQSSDPCISAEELDTFVGDADLVFVSLTDYARRVLPLLRRRGVEVWVDLHDWDGSDSAYHRDFVEQGTHLVVSDVRLDDPLALASRLARDKELVVVTHGHRGATAFFPDREPLYVAPEDQGRAVDTNGAGDAFSVGVAYGLAQGWEVGRALKAGAVLGAGCVTSTELADPALTPEWLHTRV
jgi:sugar/nucleoside kinase (ribokinase family)